jgi:hypothetical protein
MEIEVVYHSVATGDLSEEAIFDLVKKAQESNKQKNITGCLLYHKGEFIQALEGNETDVNLLLKKIENDPRNKEMYIIFKNECAKRSYSAWNMAYSALTNGDLKKLESVIDMNGFVALHSVKDSPSRVKKTLSYLSKELGND